MSSIAPSDSISSDPRANPDVPLLKPGSAPDRSLDSLQLDGLVPSAGTDTRLLFAQDNTIIVFDHTSFKVLDIFREHRRAIRGISVDVYSNSSPNRRVCSIDAERKVIIWELETRRVVGQFMPYDGIDITVPVWMRDGRHILFGNHSGDVISFDSDTEEYHSRATIHVRVTAMALAEDNNTLAIGYEEGSILIVNIAHPKLSILHNMPSSGSTPIIGLAWHNSSMRQESIMLASQKQDGGLRLWSIPKRPSADGRSTPRTIRNLVRHGDHGNGPRWFGWSKSGRIAEYFNGQVYIWDVRTTNVTFVTLQLDQLRGITNHGPLALLFTLTPNMKVNKYSINPLEGPKILGTKTFQTHELTLPADAYMKDPRRSDSRTGRLGDSLQFRDLQPDRFNNASPASQQHGDRKPAMPQALMHYTEANMVKTGSPSVVSNGSRGGASTYISSAVSSHYTSSRAPTKVNDYNKARMTPQLQDDELVKDLFPYIRASLSEVQFVPPQYDRSTTPQDIPRILLKVIFGWESDIRSLLREEFDHQPLGSPTTEILLQWFSAGTRSKSSMFNKVKAMTGTSTEATEALFQSLIDAGDIHTAVSVLLTVGEFDAAVETYVSFRMMMEAVLLVCTIYPQDWQRQIELVRRWGEIAVTQRQHELSMRCFSVTTLDVASPWPSTPSLAGTNPASKAMRLKVVTSFGPQGFHGDQTVTATPLGIGVTPIVETAISPSGARGFFGRGGRSMERGLETAISPSEQQPLTSLFAGRGKSRSRDPSESGRSTSSRRNRAQSQERRLANLSLVNGKSREREGYPGSVATTLSSATLRSQSTAAAPRPAQVDPYRVKTVQDYIGHLDEAASTVSRPRRSSRHRQPSEVRAPSRNGGYVPPAKHSPTSPISMPISMPPNNNSTNPAGEEQGDHSRGRSAEREEAAAPGRSSSLPRANDAQRQSGPEQPSRSPASPTSAAPAPVHSNTAGRDIERSQSRQGRVRSARSRDPPPVRSPSEAISRRHELTLSRVSERSEQSAERLRDEDITYYSNPMVNNVPEIPRSHSTPLTHNGRVIGLPSNPGVGAQKYNSQGPTVRGGTPLSARGATPLSISEEKGTLPATTFSSSTTQTTTLHRKSFSHSRNRSTSGNMNGAPSHTAPLYGAFPREDDPPMLPELQHLNGPPAPPNGPHSASMSLGVIRIGMEDMGIDQPDRSRSSMDIRSEAHQGNHQNDLSMISTNIPGSPPPIPTSSASTVSKSGRGRVSISESVSQKLNTVRERMRSSSRSHRSHAAMGSQSGITISPYDQTAIMINNLASRMASEKAMAEERDREREHASMVDLHPTVDTSSPMSLNGTNRPTPTIQTTSLSGNGGPAPVSAILKPTYIGYPRPQDILANLNAQNSNAGLASNPGDLPVLAPATYSATKS